MVQQAQYSFTIEYPTHGVSITFVVSEEEAEHVARSMFMPWPAESSQMTAGPLSFTLSRVHSSDQEPA
jgi:hypothetical protein